jgi:intracellular multiplication protein IcmL
MASDALRPKQKPSNSSAADNKETAGHNEASSNKSGSKNDSGILGKSTELLYTQYMRTLIYKGSFSATLTITKLSMVLNLVLAFALIAFALKSPPQQSVLGIDVNGRVQEITPLSGNSMTNTQLTNWAQDCVLKLNSYTFYSVINHLNTVMPDCLTDKAAKTFRANFESVVLDELRINQQSYEASPNGAGIVIAEGVVDGRKAYQLEIPIIVTRYDLNRQSQNFNYTIKLEIIRVDQDAFWKGVKIYNYKEILG